MKPIEMMTQEEIEQEIDHLESYFASCEEIGQGISSKESVRHRWLKQALKPEASLI